jgi:hypothetical protein
MLSDVFKEMKDRRNPIPDPTCKEGVVSADMKVCCTDECGSCGDHALCDSDGKYHEETGKLAGNCCKSRILKEAPSCDKSHAPCVLSDDYRESLEKFVYDRPNRHAMDDCTKAVPIVRKKHDEGVERGHFYARFYLGDNKFKEAKEIAIKVMRLCDEKTAESKRLIDEYTTKISEVSLVKISHETSGGPKDWANFRPEETVEENPFTGMTTVEEWQDKLENEEAEVRFYKMIEKNAKIVKNDAEKGMAKTDSLKKEVQKYKGLDVVDKFEQKADELQDESEKVYKDATELWKQWQDSSKDYPCGAPPFVDHASSHCEDGNTKFSPKCNIVCEVGYDGPLSANELRCNKQGKFGKQLYGEWQGMAACPGRVCGLPRQIAKAKTVMQNISYPHLAEYHCYEGFSMDRTATGPKAFTIACDHTGNFANNFSHKCEAIRCGKALAYKNTHPMTDEYTYTEIAHYKCLNGFTVDGTPGGLTDFTTTCQATGKFTEGVGCRPVRCGPPPSFENTIEPGEEKDQFFGNRLTFNCRQGYSTDSDPLGPNHFALTCQADGEFRVEGTSDSSILPRCLPVTAGMAPSVLHGNFIPREMFYGESALVTADSGYSTSGNPGEGVTFILKVTPQGTYAGQEEFKPVVCGKTSVENAETSFTGDAKFKDLLNFKCKSGYSTDATAEPASASFTIMCEADGDFSKVPGLGKCVNIDDCADHTCGPFGKCIDHLNNYTCSCNSGYEQTWNQETNELVCGNVDDCGPEACGVGECIDGVNDYKCDCPSGYEQKDETSDDGKVDHTCRAVVCGLPPEVTHALTEPLHDAGVKATYGAKVLYACKEGHTFDGTPTGKNHFSIDCQASKQFTETQSCEPIKCSSLPEVAHSSSSSSNAIFNESVRFDCDSGFTVDGSADGDRGFTVTCQDTGAFGEPQACKPVICGEPDTVANAQRPSGSKHYQETVKYKCYDGFTLDGEKNGPTEFEAKCQDNGKFTKLDQCMPKICGDPEKEINIFWANHKDEGKIHYPQVTEVICKDGYTVGGDAGGATSFVVKCLASGEFERVDERTCQPVRCGAPLQMPNATILKIKSPTPSKPGLTRNVFYMPMGGNIPDLWGKKPAVHDIVANIDVPSTQDLWPKLTEKDNFAVRFSGALVLVKGGMYEFQLTSDDGTKLYINGDLVADNDGLHGMQSKEGKLELTEGPHALTVEYFEKGGGAGVVLKWKGPDAGNSWTVIPQGAFQTKGGNLNFEEKAVYQCMEGFTAGGEWGAPMTYDLECLANGHLNGPTPDQLCRNVDDCGQHTCGSKGTCIDLVGPAPAYTCKCEFGYEIQVSDNGEKHCGNKDDCQGKDCGVGICKDLIGDYTCMCPNGHRIGTKDGQKTCIPIRCAESTPSLEHGRLLSDHSGPVDFPTTLRYRCGEGYSTDGTVPESMRLFQATCKDDGTLFGMTSCQKITCGTPHVVPYSKLLEPGSPMQSVEYNEKAKYECFEGYTIGGNAGGSTHFEEVCQDDGTLTPPEVCEPVRCGDAPHVPKSRPGISGSVAFGQNLIYTCDQGYTLDSSVEGRHEFQRHCQKDGKFSPLPSDDPCKPISPGSAPTVGNAKLMEYAGMSVTFGNPRIFYPDGLEYRCNPGYSTTGALSGPTKITTRVRSDGTLWPTLLEACKKISFTVSGSVKNARSGSYLPDVKVSVEGSEIGTTSSMGIFTLSDIPSGTLSLVYEKDGYIKTTRSIDVTGNIRAGGEADISMSPTMASDEWRAVIKWGEYPSDLDTYGSWGWAVAWYGGQRRSSSGMTLQLEVDQTRGYGPETLYMSGVGRCTGGEYYCDIYYQINDYTETGEMLSKSDAEVTLYNGDHVAGSWKMKDCPSSVYEYGDWWDVFIIDGMTNRLKWTCAEAEDSLFLHAMSGNRTSNGTAAFSRRKHAVAEKRRLSAKKANPMFNVTNDFSKNNTLASYHMFNVTNDFSKLLAAAAETRSHAQKISPAFKDGKAISVRSPAVVEKRRLRIRSIKDYS